MKYVFTAILVVLSIQTMAREINPAAPDFNHQSCTKSRALKAEALNSLVKITSMDAESMARFSQLDRLYKAYLFKLNRSVRSDGKQLYSTDLDQQLNLAGDCEGVDSLLLGIINSIN